MTTENKIKCDRCGRREWKDCYGQCIAGRWLNVGYGANDADLCPGCADEFAAWLEGEKTNDK